ncbi:MAG: hypothetical protein CMM52_03795 [Rhodospirillaceae bacterium]|mgnify:CR=1 FL=1|nr:hypothetical protein [Rhodospirillaceae bacterium]|tara:strand:- start:42724 stop:43479 length:756 start_codon:yes stop_codon:yes gene_type:complete
MCTVVFLRRPEHRWPLILGANRDEMMNRPWRPPGRHWPDRENVVAGIDELAGGSWLGMNDEGVVAGILNRKDSLGPDENLRSRGEIVLEALDHTDAVYAVEALAELSPAAYRSFNLFVADNRDAWWLRSLGPDAKKVEIFEIPEGISMLTAWDLNADDSVRTGFYLPQFRNAMPPHPEKGDWRLWETLMGSTDHAEGAVPGEALFIQTDRGFGTLSTSLIALESPEILNAKKIWQFLDTSKNDAEFISVEV